jgi:CBS domain-containing protein
MMEEIYKLKVRDIMIPRHNTPFVEEDASWVELLNKLSLRAHAWVVNNVGEMKVVGVVTEHDILYSMIPSGQKRTRILGVPRTEIFCIKQGVAQDIMTHNTVVCSPEETVADVFKKFSSFDIRRLAVVDENKRLLGEITIQLLVKNLRHKFINML